VLTRDFKEAHFIVELVWGN